MASRGEINKKEIQPILSKKWEVIPFVSSIENQFCLLYLFKYRLFQVLNIKKTIFYFVQIKLISQLN